MTFSLAGESKERTHRKSFFVRRPLSHGLMNPTAVREYRRLFRKLSKEGEVAGVPTLELFSGLPGVFEVGRTMALRSAIDDIVLLETCSEEGEWEGQVQYLPLR